MTEEKLLSKKIAYAMFVFFGFLFVFFGKTGKDLAGSGNILWTGKYVWQTLTFSLLGGGALGAAVAFVLYGFAEKKWQLGPSRGAEAERKDADGGKQGKVLGISLILILLAWLPAYLAYYPGICAYDAPIQIGQIVENIIIDHHPIAHTLLIKGAMVFGREVLGSVNTGIAAFIALQMAFLALSMAYALMIMQTLRVRLGWKIMMLLYCMIYPFHWFMSVSMTKDTIFSGCVLIFTTTLTVVLWENRRELRMGRRELLLAVSAIGIVLFRNNGKYAFLALLFFLLITLWRDRQGRRLWGRLLICCSGAFAAGLLLLSLLFNVTKAQQGDRREMLSMPIQQLARVMIYHGGVDVLPEDDNTMDPAHKALIDDFLLGEAYRYYEPAISDPVKRHTNTYVVRYRSGEFLRTYLQLLRQYPGDFINAALAVDAGLIYPGDVSHAYIYHGDGTENLGYVQTIWDEETLSAQGIYRESKWETLHRLLENWSGKNAYLDLPILKYAFVPGTWLYLYLILFGWLMIKRKFRMCLPMALVLGYYLTLFLGPTVQLRYLYPIMISFPFLALLCSAALPCGRE